MEITTQARPAAAPDAAAQRRFATLVEPHLPALRAFVERRDPSLVDEVMSELGVVAWRRLADLPAGHERAWLFGVARTVLLAERRMAATRGASELGEPALATLHAPALSPAVAAPLAQALATLSPRDRDLLLLTAWEGLSTAEAAHALGIRATAARMGLVRARRRLAAALDDLDPGWRGEHLSPVSDEPQAIAPSPAPAVTRPTTQVRPAAPPAARSSAPTPTSSDAKKVL